MLALTAVFAASPAACASDAPARARFVGVSRVIAFADVHGALDELRSLLRDAGVIDAEDHWAAGRAHVVSLGDLLDRGADSRRVMDLLMRLQAEAAAAGGGLHVVVGNHEAMNVLGDLRYVDRGEYAAYIDVEPAALRDREREAWEQAHGAGSGPAFDQRFPPGYFGHRAALGPEGRYGRWILGLPVAVVVNDTLFMHGGPSPVLSGMSLDVLNARYRTALADYLDGLRAVEQAGLVQPGDEFRARPRLAAERFAARASGAGTSPATGDLRSAVAAFARAADEPLLGRDGPNWYRGAALCREASEADVLEPLLRQFIAARLVVGHTTTRDRHAVTRFEGRVVKLDAGMNRSVYQGRGAALFIEGSTLRVRHSGDPKAAPLQAEALFVAPDDVDDSSVASALLDGTIVVSGPRTPAGRGITVEHGGRSIPAVFIPANPDAVRRELAAYRLDRLLGFGVVPVTAAREVQGQAGYVQARPTRWTTLAEVQRQGVRGGGWCALEPQFGIIATLDALAGNVVRAPEQLLFDADEWYAYAADFSGAFGNDSIVQSRVPAPGSEVRRRLRTLTERSLAAALGETVDAAARNAILERRNALVASPAMASH